MTNILGLKAVEYDRQGTIEYLVLLTDSRAINGKDNSLADNFTQKLYSGKHLFAYSGDVGIGDKVMRNVHEKIKDGKSALTIEAFSQLALECTTQEMVKDDERLNFVVAGSADSGGLGFSLVNTTGNWKGYGGNSDWSLRKYLIGSSAKAGSGGIYSGPLLEQAEEHGYLENSFPTLELAIATAFDQLKHAANDRGVNTRAQVGLVRKKAGEVSSATLFPEKAYVVSFEENPQDPLASFAMHHGAGWTNRLDYDSFTNHCFAYANSLPKSKTFLNYFSGSQKKLAASVRSQALDLLDKKWMNQIEYFFAIGEAAQSDHLKRSRG